MGEGRRVLFGTGYVLASTIVGLASSLVLRLVLVSFLGIADYGVLALATSLLSVIALVSDLGFASALPKFVAERPDAEWRRTMIAAAAIAAGISGLVATGLLVVLARPLGAVFGLPELPLLLVILGLQVPLSLAAITLLAAINGLRRMRLYSAVVLFNHLAGLALTASALVLGGGLMGAAIASVASAAVQLILLLVIARGYVAWRGIVPFWEEARGLFAFGIKLSATNWTSTVLYQIDVILLGLFTRSTLLVGYYSIAILLGRILWIVPGSLSVVAYPAISEYAREGARSRISGLVSRGLRFSAGIVGIGVVTTMYFGPEVLRVLFGPDALPAFPPLAILLFGMAMLGTMKALAPGISSVGRPDIGLKVALAGLAISGVLLVLLIPVLGLNGAALATSIAYGATAVLLFHYIQTTLAVSLERSWFLRFSALILALALPGAILAFTPDVVAWLRWTIGLASVGLLVLLLYVRLLAKEDTALVIASLQEAIRGPQPP